MRKFPVDDWDIQKATNLVNLEKYKKFWFEKIESDIQEQPGKFTVSKRVIKTSRVHFIDAFVETIDDIRVKDAALADQWEKMGIKNVVSGINNDWVERFEDGDVIVELK